MTRAEAPSFQPADLILARDDNGKLAGFAQAKMFRDTTSYPGPDLDRITGRGHIAAIAVLPKYRRQGLARAATYRSSSEPTAA